MTSALLIGCGRFALLPFFGSCWAPWTPAKIQMDPKITLVRIHTLFNFLDVLLILPLTSAFARLIMCFHRTGREIEVEMGIEMESEGIH